MTHSVTSWFIEQSQNLTVEPVRVFTLGGSNYSEHVVQWPKFKQSWNSIRPVSLTVNLSNGGKQFNFLKDDTTLMTAQAEFSMGFTHPTSGNELITLFNGTIERMRYGNSLVNLSFVDKFKQLTERLIGTTSEPITYSGSNYLPADIAWYAITSYGGYDNVASSSNVDIDYESWLQWSNVFSADAVYVGASFKGIKVSEALKKMGRYTDSAIFIHNNRISFKRFSIADSNQTSFDGDSIKNLSLSVDDRDVTNNMYVSGLYDTTSRYWAMTVNDENSSSINSYGLRENDIKDSSIWYINSGSAINLAQRRIQAVSVPFNKVQVSSTLKGLPRIIGETISVEDENLDIAEGYRIMEQTINMDAGEVEFNVDRSYFSSGFILDTSTLNSVDVLT